jgi:hypothetical protein
MKFNAFGLFPEIRFPKNGLEDGVSGIQFRRRCAYLVFAGS